MSNITLNPGSGGSTVATEVIGSDHYQLVKLAGSRQSYWPGYSGPDNATPYPVSVDDSGALITRGAVTTDEGTFRVNFANSSLSVTFGSVTVSGNVVTGSGFLTADAHIGDYFKISGNAESAWTQIDTIDSDTQMTLKATYPGSASGTGSRSLVKPIAGTGGSLTVTSGTLTITAGTAAADVNGVLRLVDFAPLVFRSAFSVSQRIANQTTYAGLRENSATPRWFARFKIDGTTATTVICETGRNPSGAPSAAETQTTTITLPNGATTATSLEYRVEALTESVRFYVGGVLVAEHTRVLPSQHDQMAAVVEVVNGTTPASSTSVVVDYITGKNHNKLEIGVMSDAEKLIAAQPPTQVYTFNQTGVIAINTDLVVLDCSQIRAVSVHCVSVGTTGVVTCQASNDGVNWLSNPLCLTAGGTLATLSGSQLMAGPISARYLRFRMTTATTAGTTKFTVCALQHYTAPPITAVGGSVTANIGTGALSAGTNAIGDVGIQVRANATGAMTIAKVLAAATTNATSVKGTAGRVLGWQLTNTTAAVKVVRLYNLATAPTVGTSVPVYNIVLPANASVNASFPAGISHATGIAYAITNAIADLDATAVAASDVIGAIYYA